jgi:hypothetical protein
MGPEGPEGPAGTARAYALIDPASCTGTPASCTVTRSKDIGAVTRAVNGKYCITAFNLSSEFIPAYVSVEYAGTSSPRSTAFAVAVATAPDCSADQFEVQTMRSSADTLSNNIAFAIVIP